MFSYRSFIWLITATLFIAFYFIGVKTFFRHDDWLILGNAIHFLPKDWGFLWDNRLYFSPSKLEVWFFRPFFKLWVWIGYQIFGLDHTYWLLFQYILLVLTVFIGAKCFRIIDNNPTRSLWFTFLSFCSLSFYFANVVWIGEGMMNLPQLFLLFLSLLFFLKEKRTAAVASWLCYFLSLGFKESAVFFPLFLRAIEPSIRDKKYFKNSLPFFYGLMGVYLVWRLGFIPLNPGYKPIFSWNTAVRPILFFIGLLSIPLLALLLGGYRINLTKVSKNRGDFWILLFFGLLILPHLGHPFFSPGWLLLPGFLSLWILIYKMDRETIAVLSLIKTSIICFTLSLIPILWQSYQLDWFNWSQSQKAVHDFLRDFTDETASLIEIETCPSPARPQVTFERVIGGADNLEHLWNLYHRHPMKFRFVPCSVGLVNQRSTAPSVPLILWRFPEVEFLSAKTRD